MTLASKKRETVSVEAAAAELIGRFGRVFRALKESAGSAPSDLVAIFESGSLGKRHGPVLFALALESELSVSELAERIGLGVPTTSLLVGELSRAELVTRTEDDKDRRRTIVTLHEDRRKAIEAWIQHAMTPIRRTLSRLSAPERAVFIEGWRILDEESGGDEGVEARGRGCTDEAGV
jgi:DNA-binding MarR family transcriptional regulator